ncbi:MAG: SHOCT domain-containing protein [Phycisphaerae bacterium]
MHATGSMRLNIAQVPGGVPLDAPTGEILFWGLVLILGISVLGLGVWWVRRWLFSTPAEDGVSDWSLQHLREMRDRGEINAQEFESLKIGLLSQYQDRTSDLDGKTSTTQPDEIERHTD